MKESKTRLMDGHTRNQNRVKNKSR